MLSIATLISLTAAIVQIGMGVTFLVMARAPNWRRARWFAVIAFSAAAYASVDVVFSYPGRYTELVREIGVFNYFFAAVHVSAWVVFAFGPTEAPWRGLRSPYRALVVLTLLLGVSALIPGAVTRPESQEITIGKFGVIYHQAVTTMYGDFVALWLVLVLAVPFARFVRNSRRGQTTARLRVVGFTIFFLCAIEEMLVTAGFVQFIYLADFGFLAVVSTSMIEAVRQALSDARKLAEISAQLARQVDHRTRERDEAREALINAERLAAVGQLAAGVGHEINNPLTYVRANLDLLREAVASGTTRPDSLELLDEARTGTDRIARVVNDLRAFSLPTSEKRERIQLTAVVEAALKMASIQLRHSAVVVRDFMPVGPVFADEKRLSQVLVNLFANAAQAMRKVKRDEPQVVVRIRASGELRASITISDNGCGISPEALRRLGEPYFSTRVDEGGTGLGLFVARGIIESLAGTMVFESEQGVGTTVTVTLPTMPAIDRQLTDPLIRIAPEALAKPLPLPLQNTAPKKRRILVVDDDVPVARAVARLLRPDEVVMVDSGREALELLATDDQFDAILCDVMMPDVSGVELYDRLLIERPRMAQRIAFMTGGTTIPEVAQFLARDGIRCVAKPAGRAELDALITGLLAAIPAGS